MSTVFVLSVALVCVVCFLLGCLFFTKDEASEDKRKNYIKLAAILKEYGLVYIPAILIDLAVRDLSGAYAKIKFWVQLMSMDPNAILKEFDKVFSRVLEQKLKTPEGLAYLKSKIAEHEAPQV